MLPNYPLYTFLLQTLYIDPLSSIPRCSLKDPKLEKCIIDASEKLRPRIRNWKGIFELGIPSYNPVVVPTAQVTQASEAASYTFRFRNYVVRGLDNYNLTEIKYFPKNSTFRGKLEFPPIIIIAFFEMNGHYVKIPLNGSGRLFCPLGPINATFEITGNIEKRGDHRYYNLANIGFNLAMDDMLIYYVGSDGGDTIKGAMTNLLTHQNSRQILAAVTPGFTDLAARSANSYFRWLTETYPLDKLFLEV